MPDYLGLKGDTSDNIPGVPGVGEKTAAKLLQEYGSLDDVLERADEIGGKVGENLREHADAALASRTVATIVCDVPVELDLDCGGVRRRSTARAVAQAFGELRFTSLLERVLALRAARAAAAPGAEARRTLEAACPRGRELLRARRLPAARADAAQAVDAWHRARPRRSRLGVATACGARSTRCSREERELAVAGPRCRSAVVEAERCDGRARGLLESARSPPRTRRRCCRSSARPTRRSRAIARFEAVDPARLFDCRARRLPARVEPLVLRRSAPCTRTTSGAPLPDCRRRRAESAAIAGARAAELAVELERRLDRTARPDVLRAHRDAARPGARAHGARGRGRGHRGARGLAAETAAQIDALRREIYELAGCEFTIDSPKQLAEVLFEKLGLPPQKRTKTGYSTDAEVLAALAPLHPIAEKIVAYRELTKLKSTYIDALPRLLGEDGRLHTSFNQTVAATGRLSSSNPNLQNIPVRTELGRRIRAAFVPAEPGDVMVSADYSQIELRILAHLSGDEGLIAAFTQRRGLPRGHRGARLRRRARRTSTPEHARAGQGGQLRHRVRADRARAGGVAQDRAAPRRRP